MSLIHDSLRKLENNQTKEAGLDSNFDNFKTNNGFNAKKLWMLLVAVVGIVMIVYAYLMLEKYQKQNELLMNDMKQLQHNNTNNNLTTAVEVDPIKDQPNEQSNSEDELIIQPPIQMKETDDSPTYASLLKKIDEQEKALIVSKQNQDTNADFLLDNAKAKIDSEPKPIIKMKTTAKKIDNKLSIKETRLLVNNLQMQIDSKNTEEVESLLNKLLLSSGENSIVYLRMHAFWATTINDDATATTMYKKILFQKPNDIQANTNLALLEARNNNIEQALNRLKTLRIEYPSDKSIVTYLERIENMHAK